MVTAVAPSAAISIPDDLVELRQWVAAAADKRPINPRTGRNASPKEARTWGTFAEARARAESDGHPDVGFVFTADDPFVGIDLDKCRDPSTGLIQPWAEQIVREVDSYAEVSRSGTGLHIIARGGSRPKVGGRAVSRCTTPSGTSS